MIVQQLNSSVAKIYEVGQNYQRFNQKNNLIIQSYWNKEIKKLEENRLENLKNYVKKSKSGYSAMDYAFFSGAINYFKKINYGINICDQKANSWSNENKDSFINNEIQLQAEEITAAVKKAAKMYGASAAKVTSLDRKWVYAHWFDDKTKESYPLVFSDDYNDPKYEEMKEPILLDDGTRIIPKTMQNVIVLLFEMDYECLQYSPTLLAFGESVNAYSQMGLTTINLAEFIRSLGYNAIPSINCTALNVPLAIDAGLGQLGRNGKLISPEFGSKIRIAKIITDLPLVSDKPIDFGVTQFCDACKKCAKECPAKAIAFGPRDNMPVDEAGNSYYRRWVIDHKKCYKYWSECGTNCNICISVCSYNRGYQWTKSVLNSTKQHNSLVDNLIDNLEDNYGLEFLHTKSDSFWNK